MTAMRAFRVHEHGGTEVLCFEEIPVPQPGPGEVRVKVAWSALNHLDTWVRRGVPGHRFPLPMTPGCDFSGMIDELGDGVSGWAIGARVAIAPKSAAKFWTATSATKPFHRKERTKCVDVWI